MDSYNSPTTAPLYRGTQIVWYVLGIVEALLFFRLFLKLFGADPSAGFTSAIYTMTAPLVAPFVSVFHITSIQGSVFEWTTLLAALVYGIVAMGIVKLLVMSMTVSTPEAAQKLEGQG